MSTRSTAAFAPICRPAAAILLLLLLATRAMAAGNSVTIVFDASVNEFRCWYEGLPTDPVTCDARAARPYFDGIHFYRGQTIHLKIVGSTVADRYVFDLTVNDITEPAIAIFGGFTELPKVRVIEPLEQVIPKGMALAEGPGAIDVAGDLYRLLDESSTKDLDVYLNAVLIEPAAQPKVQAAASWSGDRVISRLKALLDDNEYAVTQARAIKEELDAEAAAFQPLRLRYCRSGTSAPSERDLASFIALVTAMNRNLDQQQALATALARLDVGTLAKSLADEKALIASPEVRQALIINTDALDQFLQYFGDAFPVERRMSSISAMTLAGSSFARGAQPQKPFLERINDANEGKHPRAENLATLKANLARLSERLNEIRRAASVLQRLRQIARAIPADVGLNTPAGYQDFLDTIAIRTIGNASDANCIARGMPLPPQFSPVVNRWYGSKEVTLTLKRGTRLPLFSIKGVIAEAATTAPPPAGATTAGARQVSEQPTEVGRTRFQIHNLYHLQMGAGIVRSGLQDRKYQLATKTVEGQPEEKFFVVTRDRDYRVFATIDLTIYPWARDFFPRTARYAGEPSGWWKAFGGVIGFSVADPTKDFIVGGAFMPRAGVGIKAGWHFGYVDALPAGVEINKPLTADVTTVTQKLGHAKFVGIELNAQLFKDLVAMIFK